MPVIKFTGVKQPGDGTRRLLFRSEGEPDVVAVLGGGPVKITAEQFEGIDQDRYEVEKLAQKGFSDEEKEQLKHRESEPEEAAPTAQLRVTSGANAPGDDAGPVEVADETKGGK